MPHAENTISQCEPDSSEPCLKRLRTDDNSRWSCKRTTHTLKEDITQLQEKCFFLTDHNAIIDIAVNKDYGISLPSSAVSSDHEPNKYTYQSQSKHGNYQNKSKCMLPKVDKTKDWSSATSDGKFTETSTAFIGPVFPPPPGVQNGRSYYDDKQSPSTSYPCYKINTVELGKTQSRSKGNNGMDYELRQFYKELHLLEAETDETPNVKKNEHSVCSYIQEPVSGNGLRNSAPALQVEYDVTPHNNQVFHAGQANWGGQNMTCRTNTHVNNTVLPRFCGLPPTIFNIPHGPPLPVGLHPSYFPDKSINPYELYPISHNHYGCSDGFQRTKIQQKWNNICIPENSRYRDQVSSTRELLPEDDYRFKPEPMSKENLVHEERHLPHNPGIAPQMFYDPYRDINKPSNSKKLILLRGVPGSGKSTLACNLLEQHPDGIVFSTDDYFCQREGYMYNVKLLGDAHDWNQNRAKRAMDDGRSPIIIDNTNIQAWEMKPYVQMALERDYTVEFLEPDTWWKLDPLELEKRNTHCVPREKISQMLDRYEYDVTIPVVLNSVEPPHRRTQRPPPQPRQRWGGSVDVSHHSSAFHNR